MSGDDLLATGARAGVVAASLGIWYWTQRLIAAKPPPGVAGGGAIGDRVHDWTAGWNEWFAAHPRAADATLVASSLAIDVTGLALIASSVFGSTFRPFLAVLLLFVLRQVCQGLVTLPVPPGMIWRHPGVPSLLVTYGTSNDLFFSGHTAICVLATMEAARAGPPGLAIAAGAVAVLQAVLVLVLRAHWTMDVFAAAFTAVCCDALAARLAPGVDAWLRSVA